MSWNGSSWVKLMSPKPSRESKLELRSLKRSVASSDRSGKEICLLRDLGWRTLSFVIGVTVVVVAAAAAAAAVVELANCPMFSGWIGVKLVRPLSRPEIAEDVNKVSKLPLDDIDGGGGNSFRVDRPLGMYWPLWLLLLLLAEEVEEEEEELMSRVDVSSVQSGQSSSCSMSSW